MTTAAHSPSGENEAWSMRSIASTSSTVIGCFVDCATAIDDKQNNKTAQSLTICRMNAPVAGSAILPTIAARVRLRIVTIAVGHFERDVVAGDRWRT